MLPFSKLQNQNLPASSSITPTPPPSQRTSNGSRSRCVFQCLHGASGHLSDRLRVKSTWVVSDAHGSDDELPNMGEGWGDLEQGGRFSSKVNIGL